MNHDPRSSRPDHLAAAASDAASQAGMDAVRDAVRPHLPDLELGACIGRGGMGAVFRARQWRLGRDVAVKVLLPPPERVEDWSDRFQREAQALARLQHPGIVTVHDYGQADGLAWLVMELVEGVSLRTLLDEGRLAADEALAIVSPICEALQYAHARGIVHRDIKPENVLIDQDGRVRLVDFGLARLTTPESDRLTRTGQAMGTPRYMAPEQLERPLEVDHRADVFSLGVVLYEMLTGQVPAGVVEPPSRRAGVDVRLDEVVQRALQREPARRYQSAAEFDTGIKNVGQRSVEATPARPTGRVVGGWTFAELLACVAPFGTAFVLMASQRGMRSAADISVHWSLVVPFAMVAMLWWALPVFTAVHWLVGRVRGRAVPPSMPMVRVFAAAVMVALTMLVHGWSSQQPGMVDVLSPARMLIDDQRMWLMLLGVAVGLAGSWSRKGAHRLLFGARTERALFAVALTLASLLVVVGAVAALTPDVRVQALSSIYSDSLPLSAQLPVVVGGILAIVLRGFGQMRGGAVALSIGLAATACIHVLGRISYHGWSTGVYACLFVGAFVGMIAVAGTARPKLLRPTWSSDPL